MIFKITRFWLLSEIFQFNMIFPQKPLNKDKKADVLPGKTNEFLMLLWEQEIASKIDKLDHEIYLYSKYFFKRLTHMIWAAPAVNICKTKQTAVQI